jgi:hypothetical protein
LNLSLIVFYHFTSGEQDKGSNGAIRKRKQPNTEPDFYGKDRRQEKDPREAGGAQGAGGRRRFGPLNPKTVIERGSKRKNQDKFGSNKNLLQKLDITCMVNLMGWMDIGFIRIYQILSASKCLFQVKLSLCATGVNGLSHVAFAGKRAFHFGAACVLNYFHFEIRHLVDNRVDCITAAINAPSAQLLHFFLLFLNIPFQGCLFPVRA